MSRLDDMKRLAFRVTKDLKSSIDVEDKPVCLTEWSTMNESQNGASSPSVCFEHFNFFSFSSPVVFYKKLSNFSYL